MKKALGQVRGALRRGNIEALRCKRIWLARVIRSLPDTDCAREAGALLEQVNAAIPAAPVPGSTKAPTSRLPCAATPVPSTEVRPGLLVVHPDFPWRPGEEGAVTDGRRLLPVLRRLVKLAESGDASVATIFFNLEAVPEGSATRDLLDRLARSSRWVVPDDAAASPQAAAAWLRGQAFPSRGDAGGFWRHHCVRDMARLLGLAVPPHLSALK